MLGRLACSRGPMAYSSIQPFLLYVFFHTFRNKFLDGTFGAYRIADFSRRDFLIHVVQQVQSNAWKNQVTLGRLPGKRLRGLRPRPQFFGERASDVGQRVSWATGNDECALGKKRLGVAPFGNIFERIDANQKKKLVDLL